MGYDDIRKHLAEMYGVDISSAKISLVTDKLIHQIKKKWNMPVRDWAETISQLDIYFEGRLNVGL